ncbi:hypothetical protein AL073_18160 [Loktanella sp. 1ANDIMAR09]|nr:hypothetical protein AL073_18160 [Loktanella sp. 1ANDIMAR09]
MTNHVFCPSVLFGEVKWFDVARGYGFVTTASLREDILLHKNVLQNFGRDSVADGAIIEFEYAEFDDRLRVTGVLSVKGVAISGDNECEEIAATVIDGCFPARVKWFDTAKGYGFVNRFGSLEDVFVGSGVVKEGGLNELICGQALCVQISEVEGRKRVHQIHEWVTN